MPGLVLEPGQQFEPAAELLAPGAMPDAQGAKTDMEVNQTF